MMDLKTLKSEIDKAYGDLIWQKSQWAAARQKLIDKEYTNAAKEAGLKLSGQIDGKNAAIREAQLKELMMPDLDELYKLEEQERTEKIKLEIKSDYLSWARAKLRLAEIEVQVEGVEE